VNRKNTTVFKAKTQEKDLFLDLGRGDDETSAQPTDLDDLRQKITSEDLKLPNSTSSDDIWAKLGAKRQDISKDAGEAMKLRNIPWAYFRFEEQYYINVPRKLYDQGDFLTILICLLAQTCKSAEIRLLSNDLLIDPSKVIMCKVTPSKKKKLYTLCDIARTGQWPENFSDEAGHIFAILRRSILIDLLKANKQTCLIPFLRGGKKSDSYSKKLGISTTSITPYTQSSLINWLLSQSDLTRDEVKDLKLSTSFFKGLSYVKSETFSKKHSWRSKSFFTPMETEYFEEQYKQYVKAHIDKLTSYDEFTDAFIVKVRENYRRLDDIVEKIIKYRKPILYPRKESWKKKFDTLWLRAYSTNYEDGWLGLLPDFLPGVPASIKRDKKISLELITNWGNTFNGEKGPAYTALLNNFRDCLVEYWPDTPQNLVAAGETNRTQGKKGK